MSENEDVRRGTGNVFADLGYPDAETHLLKAELVSRIQDVLEERQLTQTAAARITGVSRRRDNRAIWPAGCRKSAPRRPR